MENNNISFIEYEAEMTRNERKERRLISTILVLSGLWFVSNVFWIIKFFG